MLEQSKNLGPIIMAVAICLAFSACQAVEIDVQESLTQKMVLSEAEYNALMGDNRREITDEEVMKLVESSGLVPNVNAQIKRAPITRTEGSKLVIRYTADNKDGIYVSKDARFPVIVAYVPVDTLEDNPMLNLSMDVLEANLEKAEQVKDSLKDITMHKIAARFNVEKSALDSAFLVSHVTNLGNSSTTRSTPVVEPEGTILQLMGPLLETKWGTGAPYSNKFPAVSCSELWWTEKQPVAAIVVGVAQVLSYYEPTMVVDNSYVDWSYLKETEEIIEPNYFHQGDPQDKRDMVAYLMKECSDKCKVTYNCATVTYSMKNVRNFLNTYGIIMDNERNFDLTQVKNSIVNQKMVFCAGTSTSNEGHSWLLDGYCGVKSQSLFYDVDYYVHANMCNGTSGTGYYLIGQDNSLSFETGFATFNTNKIKIYPNVRRTK